jgi:hypothetical protein
MSTSFGLSKHPSMLSSTSGAPWPKLAHSSGFSRNPCLYCLRSAKTTKMRPISSYVQPVRWSTPPQWRHGWHRALRGACGLRVRSGIACECWSRALSWRQCNPIKNRTVFFVSRVIKCLGLSELFFSGGGCMRVVCKAPGIGGRETRLGWRGR